VVNGNPSNTVTAFTINSVTGQLTSVAGSPYAVGTGAGGLSVDRTGKFLYVANSGSNNVSAFTINGATGQLTQVTG
jgi:6-phosphogluconolactonase